MEDFLMRDKNSFRQRYKYWKETGELPYSGGLKRDLSNQAQSEEAPVKSGILPGYDGGRDGMFIKYVDSYRVNPETGGVYDKVGDIKEGAVILPEVEVTARKPEFMRMQDEMNRMRSIQSRQGLSGSDPLGQFVVEGVALNPVFKALGTAGLYTLGRYGESLTGFARPQNWARAKLITREMDRSLFGIIGSPVLQPTKRTRVGDVEIDNPGLYYHQADAGKSLNFVSTGRMRTPLEEYWLAKEEAGERIPLAIRSGIKPGYPQDPGSAMFAQGGLWYGLTPNKPDLLVTARGMPIANKNASIMSDKTSLKALYEQGSRRVTDDNIYTQGPHNRQNTAAYTWEPGYGYRRVFAEKTPTLNWADATRTPQITPENATSIIPEQWTAAQDAAIARGDMAEAKRLRDLHFKASAPNTKITEGVYHGSRRKKDFNSFDLKYFGYTDGGTGGYGHYFGPLNHAVAYTNPRKFYLNVENPYTGKHTQFFNRDSYFRDNELFGRIPSREDAIRYKEGFEKYKNEFAGKDGVIDNDPIWGNLGPVYTVPKGNQIKLADTVTYDDKGVRIPLGLRDNFKINDIRYGLLPFIGLGTAGTLYRTLDRRR